MSDLTVAAAAEVPLSVTGLAFGFKELLFSDVELQVGVNEFVSLMGENGSGKSTLLDCLAGHLQPNAGEIRFWGQSNSGSRREQLQGRVGWVISQNEVWAPWLRCEKIFGMLADLYPTWNQDLYRDLVARFRLDVRKRVGHLSMGESSKLRLIKALAFEPELLILDELTANLSPESKEEVTSVLLEIFSRSKMSVLYVCHSPEEARRLSDRVLCLTKKGLAPREERS